MNKTSRVEFTVELVRILTEPKNALVKQYQKLLEYDMVDLEFQPEALAAAYPGRNQSLTQVLSTADARLSGMTEKA